MTAKIINLKSIEDIENLAKTYGESAMFMIINNDLEQFSVADLRFYANETDFIDWDVYLV